jgi:hypothetical protein
MNTVARGYVQPAPILEIFARITIVTFFLVLPLRITLERQTGGTTSLRGVLRR